MMQRGPDDLFSQRHIFAYILHVKLKKLFRQYYSYSLKQDIGLVAKSD